VKHTITTAHEVEAASWDLAVEAMLRAPFAYLIDCRVKSPGKRLVHVAPGSVHLGLQRLNAPPELSMTQHDVIDKARELHAGSDFQVHGDVPPVAVDAGWWVTGSMFISRSDMEEPCTTT